MPMYRRTNGLEADRILSLKITDSMNDKLVRVAEEAKMSKSEYVRQAIIEKMERGEAE